MHLSLSLPYSETTRGPCGLTNQVQSQSLSLTSLCQEFFPHPLSCLLWTEYIVPHPPKMHVEALFGIKRWGLWEVPRS